MSEFIEILQNLKPFIIPAIIIIALLNINENKQKDKNNKKDSKEAIGENSNDYFEIDNDKKNQDEFDSIKISIKEQNYENTQMIDVEAKGPLNFTEDQINQSEKENEGSKIFLLCF